MSLVPFILTIILSIIFTPWQTSELEKLNTDKGFDSASIRGWMTVKEVSEALGLCGLYTDNNLDQQCDYQLG